MCTLDKHEPSFILGKSIATLYRYGRWFMEQNLAPYDFGSGQHLFIFYLYQHNGTNQDEISKALSLDKATTARALQKLEEHGYVTRKISEKDKRFNQVFLTEKAYNIKKEVQQISQHWTEILTDGMTADEQQHLSKLIEQLICNAQSYKIKSTTKGDSNDTR